MSRRPSLPQPSAGISRVDQKSTRTHGYVGRLGYRQTETGWRPAYKAFFGDATHGGPLQALKAAEAWLRQARRKLAADDRTGAPSRARPNAAPRKAASRGTTARKGAGAKRVGVKRAGVKKSPAKPARRVVARRTRVAASSAR